MATSLPRQAFKESAEALRLDTGLRIVIAVIGAVLSGALIWFATGSAGWGGLASLLAALGLFVPVFIYKCFTVSAARVQAADQRASDLEQRLSDLEKQRANERDPDGIYQLGSKVAEAQHPTVLRQRSLVHFAALTGAHDLDLDREYEYRDLVLTTVNSQGGASVQNAGGRPERSILGLTCSIVRKRD
jgi:hypothetical protein